MLMRYTGGLAAVTPPGMLAELHPGDTIELEDEQVCARLIETGDWEPAEPEKPAPKRKTPEPPARQVGG